MIYDKGEIKMNKQILFAALSLILGLSGCARYSESDNYCKGPNCGTETYVAEQEIIQQDPAYICQTAPNSSLCQKDPFVNYTRTAADFRAYGERTPRDHMISQSGAGNNLSAAIPPSIDHEVIAYEEQIRMTTPNNALPDPNVAPMPVVAGNVNVADANPAATDAIAMEEDVVANNQDDEVVTDIEIMEEVDEEDPVQDWLAEEGQNLKALLTQWSDQSGWRLVWNTNRNYVLSAGAMFRGRFADVSSALIRAFARARPAPIATFYKGNRVLVVETMEDENAYE